ncbi:MAG: hypothetical protein IPG93_02530 [Burkholderiales bacterium]|nr:hypothetical protein [Burkholderiales bacterium]
MFDKILIANRGDKARDTVAGLAAQPNRLLVRAAHAGDLTAMETHHV